MYHDDSVTLSAFLSLLSQCSSEGCSLCLGHSCHSGISLHQHTADSLLSSEFHLCFPQPIFPTFLVYSFFSQRTSSPQWLPKNHALGINFLRNSMFENVFISLLHWSQCHSYCFLMTSFLPSSFLLTTSVLWSHSGHATSLGYLWDS